MGSGREGGGRGRGGRGRESAACNLMFSDLNVCLWSSRRIYNLRASLSLSFSSSLSSLPVVSLFFSIFSISSGAPSACATHAWRPRGAAAASSTGGESPVQRGERRFLYPLYSLLVVHLLFHRPTFLYAWRCAGAITGANQDPGLSVMGVAF